MSSRTSIFLMTRKVVAEVEMRLDPGWSVRLKSRWKSIALETQKNSLKATYQDYT